MTPFEQLDALLAATPDDDEVVDALLRFGPPELVRTLLVREIEARRRALVLRVEQSDWRSAAAELVGGSAHLVEHFKTLASAPIRLGDGTAVELFQMTRAQHLQRIAMLTRLRNGIDDTISRHREAIALLDLWGVDRLADIPAAA